MFKILLFLSLFTIGLTPMNAKADISDTGLVTKPIVQEYFSTFFDYFKNKSSKSFEKFSKDHIARNANVSITGIRKNAAGNTKDINLSFSQNGTSDFKELKKYLSQPYTLDTVFNSTDVRTAAGKITLESFAPASFDTVIETEDGKKQFPTGVKAECVYGLAIEEKLVQLTKLTCTIVSQELKFD